MLRIIAGEFGGRFIKAIPGNNTRPTTNRVKESLFSIIQGYIKDSTVLDLFSGTGSLGLEALSRGSKRAVFVENNPKTCLILKENIITLNLTERSRLLKKDVLKALPALQ